jgi:ubiquinone/menaquinone biosynthesis C-methylase UbiE
VATLEPPPRVLDVGTGTGVAALALADWFPAADVVGVDLSPAMLAEAERKDGRARFEVADASRLPFADGSFDLVVLMNAVPFFDELARVTAPGGTIAFSFSRGPETPIYVATERLEHELARRGFTDFEVFSADPATAFRARKR